MACGREGVLNNVGVGGGCLVASHNLPHFTLGKFDQVVKCLVHN